MHTEAYLLSSLLLFTHLATALPTAPLSSLNLKRQDSIGSIANSFGEGGNISPELGSSIASLHAPSSPEAGIVGEDGIDRKLKRQDTASLLQQMQQQQAESMAENQEFQAEAQSAQASDNLVSENVSKSKSKRQDIANALQSLQQASAASQEQSIAAQTEESSQVSKTNQDSVDGLIKRHATTARLVSRQDAGDIDSQTAQNMQQQEQMFQSEMQAQNQMQQQTTEQEFAQKMGGDGSGSEAIQK